MTIEAKACKYLKVEARNMRWRNESSKDLTIGFFIAKIAAPFFQIELEARTADLEEAIASDPRYVPLHRNKTVSAIAEIILADKPVYDLMTELHNTPHINHREDDLDK